MASFSYLWRHRAKFSFFDLAFYIAWSKRILTLKELVKRNQRRSNLISQGAIISETAEIGQLKADGNKKFLIVGNFTTIGKVEFALHDKIIIGNNVCINDGAILLTASHDLNDSQWPHKKRPIVIEDYAWVCTNAIILPGVTIGYGAVVGAGAVVSKSVEPLSIVVGNPALPTLRKRTEVLNYKPTVFLAANLAWIKG